MIMQRGNAKTEDSATCASIQTLVELAAALQDPSAPLIIDLGGRFFGPEGVATTPHHPGPKCTASARTSSENDLDLDDLNSCISTQSDSRMAIGAGGACTTDAVGGATSSSSSVHPSDDEATLPPRESARQATSRNLGAPEPELDVEMEPPRPASGDEPRADPVPNGQATVEHAAVAAHAQAHEVPPLVPLSAGLQDDADGASDSSGDDPSDLMNDDDSDEDASLQEAQAIAASTKPAEPKVYLDICRPGTVLCNGSIELPEHMAIRITASCSLQSLRLRGLGTPAEECWGYTYPGLIDIRPPEAAGRIQVDLSGVEIMRACTSNGIRVWGACDVKLTHCIVRYCRRNGMIVQGPAARATIRHCKFFQNEASGLWVISQGHVAASHTYFGDNTCNGAACWDGGSCLSAFRCQFHSNNANGVRFLYGPSGSLDACTITENCEQGLEAGEAATRVRVDDCTITCNSNWAVKTYKRAQVSLNRSTVNRGQEGSLSIYGSDPGTTVRATHCTLDGTKHIPNEVTFTQVPPAEQS